MACSAFTFAKNGRRGIGINQPQAGLHYPFVQPTPEAQYLIADFYLAYEDLTDSHSHPLRLKWAYGLGCADVTVPSGVSTARPNVQVIDANDSVVFDSTTSDFASWGWGAKHPHADPDAVYDYQVYEWISANTVCRLVKYNTWPQTIEDTLDDDSPRDYPVYIEFTDGTLDERSVYRLPKRVNSVKVFNGVDSVGAAANSRLTGTLELRYGYNTELITQPQQRRGLRATNQIQLNAVPGAGLGKYFNCPDTSAPIYAINGMTGPDIMLEASDCIWIRRPTTLVNDKLVLTTPSSSSSSAGSCICPTSNNTASVEIVSNCPACCQCDDYVQVANYMNRTADRYRPIGAKAGDIVSTYEANIARWLAQQACRLQKPLQAALAAQRCPYMDVVVQFCNQCSDCAQHVILNMAFSTVDGQSNPSNNSATTVCGYTNITTPASLRRLETITGTWPNFSVDLGKVDIGNAAKAEFRLHFANATPTIVRLALTGTIDGAPIKAGCAPDSPEAAVIISEALFCSPDGTTSVSCAEGAQAIKLNPGN